MASTRTLLCSTWNRLTRQLFCAGGARVAYRPFSRRSERRLRELQRDCDRLQRRMTAERGRRQLPGDRPLLSSTPN